MSDVSSTPATRPTRDRDAQRTDDRDALRIDDLMLRARLLADAFMAGHHSSFRFGRSSEFAEHKVYAPGDDLRTLDWKAYARMDRYYVRRFFDDKRIDLTVIIDASASMAYAGGATGERHFEKWRYAKTLAAALVLLAQRQGDASGISLFAGRETAFIAPRARSDQTQAILHALDAQQPAGETGLGPALDALMARPSRRGLVVLLSDFFDTDPDALTALAPLRQRGSDIVVGHVLHRDEVDFPFDGVVRFLDMEGEREAIVDAPAVQRAYLEELAAFQDALKKRARALDFRYATFITDEPARAALQSIVLPEARRR